MLIKLLGHTVGTREMVKIGSLRDNKWEKLAIGTSLKLPLEWLAF